MVVIHGGVEERARVNRWGDYRWYDPWWGPYGGTIEVSYYEQGTLVIDIVDPVDKELAWRGIATGIVREGGRSQKELDEIVSKVLRTFPPKGKK